MAKAATTAGFKSSTTEKAIVTPARNLTPSTKGKFLTATTAGFLDACHAGNIGADKSAASNDANT